MTMFGINIDIDSRNNEVVLFESRVIADVVKRKDERELFNQFLNQILPDNKTILEELLLEVEQEAAESLGKTEVGQEILVSFITSIFKASKVGNSNQYQAITRKVVEKLKPDFRDLHSAIDRGKYNGQLPFGYPDTAKEAEAIIVADIKDSINDQTKVEYFKRVIAKRKIQELAKEMFYAINKLGLEEDELLRYQSFMFSLRRISQLPIRRNAHFRQALSESIKTNKPMNFIIIKCLRYCYPFGSQIHLVPHMDDASIDTKDGKKHSLKSEKSFFERLERVKKLCEVNGINHNLHILIEDFGVDDLFPSGGHGVISEQSLEHAKTISIDEYRQAVKAAAFKGVKVLLLSDYLKNQGVLDIFLDRKRGTERKFRKGDASDISENAIEAAINYRFESNNSIFASHTSRDMARDSIYRIFSGIIALDTIKGDQSVIISEDRGVENKFIAGQDDKKGPPVVFIQLRDKADN